MKRCPVYEFVSITPGEIIIKDIGPWDLHPTITNSAESVIDDLRKAQLLRSDVEGGLRRVLYYDSLGQLDELVHNGESFTGFKEYHTTSLNHPLE